MLLRNNQSGKIDPLAMPLIVSVLVTLGVGSFGIWSYLQFQDQKTDTDEKIASAIVVAEEAQKLTLEADFAEREKTPHNIWRSSSSIGSIEITYPRTWSVFVDEKDGTSKPLSGFFHPNFISADDSVRSAMRIFVDESDYSREVSSYDSLITAGTVTAKPITRAGVTGIRFDGQIDKDYVGAIVILPLRDKTVKIWTESEVYLKDFNDIIIKNLTFEK